MNPNSVITIDHLVKRYGDVLAVNGVSFIPSQPVTDETLAAIPGVAHIERNERSITVTGMGDLATALITALASINVRVSSGNIHRSPAAPL